MKKRVFSILLSIAVCLSMMSVGAWAEIAGEGGTAKQSSNVAEVTIGETVTQYTDITEAFTAAQGADSAEVKLLNNAEITTTKNSDGKEILKGIDLVTGNITLDLNGRTLSGKQTSIESTVSDSILFNVYCTFTVKDSTGRGAIVQSNSVAAVRAAGEGTVNIDGGTIENTSSKTENENCAVLVMGSSNVTISGGTIRGAYRGVYVNSYDSSAALTVTGSPQIHGEKSKALLVEKAKSITLSGGTFTTNATDNHSILNSSSTAESLLAAGYRYEDGEGNQAAYSENKNGVVGKAVVSFVKDEVTYVYTYWTNPGEFKTKTISEFTYIDENTTTLNEGFYVVKGNVTISGDVTAVSDNVSIILCDDSNLTINGSLLLPKTATGREVKIYGQKDSSGSMTVTSSDDFAIKYSGENPKVDVAWVNVYGGSLTAAGSGKATDSDVWLDAGPNMMMKCTDLIKNELVAKNDLMHIGENTASFRFERCTEHEWKYTNSSGNTDSHYKSCNLCSFYGGTETHSASTWTCKGDEHTGYCVCGKEMETEAHDLIYVINSDGLTHSEKCSKCDYAAAPETHNFNKTETTVSGVTFSTCEKCEARFIATYNDEKYASLQSAVNKAAEVGGTVTLAAELVGDEITVTEGNVTIDLNGKKWAMSYVTYLPLTVEGGNVTLKNGKIHQSGSSSDARSAIVVKSGSLTLESDVSVKGGSRENVTLCSVDMQGGSLTLKQGAALLTGLQVPENEKLADYLPAGTAFVKCTYEYDGDKIAVSDEYVSGVYTTNKTSEGMAIVEHKHNCTADKKYTCDCGYVCTHKTFANGLCTVCGYACPHISMNADGMCGKCHVELTASVTDSNGKTSYYADGYYPNTYNTRSGLDFAFEAAASGSTVTVLGGSSPTAWLNNGKELTLELNGKSVRDIYVGRNNGTNSLTVRGNGSIGSVYVHANNTVDLTGWSGNMEKLYVYSGGKATLKGGTFNKVVLSGNTAGSLLASGYAFRYADGSCVRYAATDDLTDTVTVVRCNIHHVDSETGHCDYCDEAFVARMGDTHYFYTLGFALDTAAEDGSTVTLLADVNQNATFNGGDNPVTLEMNGKALTAEDDSRPALTVSAGTLTVSGDGKINTLNVGKGKLNVSGNNVEVGSLNVSEGGKASLAGGKYSSITAAEGVELKDFLAAGMKYWSRNSNNEETFIEGDTNSITDADTIVIHACEHQWVFPNHCSICGDTHIHTAPNNEGKCDICGLVIEAEVGGVYYTELYYAMEAASKMDNKPVVLMYADSHPLNTSGVCTVPDGDYTVNTNGKNIEVRMLSINGKLYITGGGTIDSEIWINDTLTLMNVVVTGPVTVNYSEESSISGSLTANFSQINGKLTVKGGKAEINSTEIKGGILVEGGNVTAADLNTKISGAEVTGGSMTITQGKIEGENGLALKGGTVNVRDYAYISKITEDGGALDISGGTIGDLTVNSGDARLAGGKYINGITLADGLNYADILADGYAFKDSDGNLLKPADAAAAGNLTVGECTNSTEADSEGRCPYCGLQFVAEAGGTKYTTITAALNADSNVKLIADVNINEQLIINADNAVIDLNGKTINCNVVGNAILVNGGTLIIKDSSEGKSGEICDKCNETSAAVCVSGGKLIIESGNYTISGDYSTAVKQIGGSLEIKGGSFYTGLGETCYAIKLEGGTEFKLSGTPELTAHHNNEQRCLVIGADYKGTVSLSGGTFGYIDLKNNMTLKDILAVGYGFKKNENTWVSDGKSIAGATVKQLPIQSLSYDDSISINYGEKAILTVMPEKAKDAGEVTYQWYTGTSSIAKANSNTLEIADLTVNETGYTYYVEATCDGYTYRSEAITVTVNKVASTYEEAPAPKANLSYTGEAQELITAGSTKDGTIEYRVNDQTTGSTYIPTATNAGTYTVYYRIVGDGNHNDSEEQSIEVTIAPMKLYGAVIPEIEAVTKTFDGTNETNLSSVKFYKENRNDKIEIDPSAYEITDVHFNDANAGNDKSLFFTVTLKSNNYILLTRSGELVRKETYECGRSGGYIIAKAAAPTLENADTSLKYADTTEQTASVTGKMPANAGTLIYAKGTEDLINYVDKWSVEEDGTVTYTISGANAGTVITLPVKISSTNYNDTTVNVIITITKATPTGEPAYDRISEKDKTLADTNLSDKDKDGKNKFSVEGTVKWADDDTTEVKQGEKYKWIFTPTDTANYNTLTGEITLWPYPAGGGIVAPADEEVITVEDKTSSETTTKTTVKDTKTETVKNEQGEEISKVTATVSEKVAEKLVDQAVSNKSDTVEITVKSNDGNKAEQTEIEIPKSAVESIAKDTEADLVIKTDNSQVILDNKTLETIAAAAEGDTVKITVNENTQLKETQKPALDVIGKNGKLFDIKAVIGDKYIHDFKGGKAHVTLPMPEKLKGKDVVIIYINNKGICEILNHTVETVGAEEYIKFTTSHFSNFAVVEKADAEKIIDKQNADKINSLIREAKLKATTSKTSKKNVKIKVSVKNSNSLIKEAKAMGYTVKYKFYRSTKKASKYKAVKTKTSNLFINTKGKKGTKYYYKAKVMVYDGKKLVAQTTLKQCSYGARTWSK